ncbi:MAG: peptidase sortase [Rubrobacteraceae bacterium]|jgi:sortase A|nr:peptidase sortase [Rubrobacteraceae bacterium]
MGKRSDRRKFRRRRRWAAFFLLLSLTLMVFGVMLLSGMGSPDQQPSASGGVERATVERAASVRVAEAPEAASGQKEERAQFLASEEEDKKTAAEKNEAAQKADEKEAASHQVAQRPDQKKPSGIPTPPTNDLWMSIPALGLYDNYVTNSGAHSAMDYGAIKLPHTAFPWQDNANTYIAAHRLGWPGTASDHQFYNLPLLAEGDVIYLGDVNGTTYTYEVTGFKEITPDETWVTTPQGGRDMLSLQTCIENFGDYWTMGPNWYVRYIVQADRVSVDVAK